MTRPPAEDRRAKRRKAHATEVDTSNGALFLRIADLERKVTYLMRAVDEMRPKVENAHLRTMRIGGGLP